MLRRPDGFSLLEILVAFSIMAVALTVVLRVFGSGVSAAVNSEDYAIATQIAESLMARTGVETPLQPGEFSGVEGERYEWRVSIQPLPVPQAAKPRFKSQQQEDEEPQRQLMSVEVQVGWGDEDRRRVLALHTVKLLQVQSL